MGGAKKGYVNIPFLFLLVATLVVGALTHSYTLLRTPTPLADKPQLVQIKSGWGSGRISQFLAQKGLIPSARLFTLLARLKGGGMKAGEYRLKSNLSPWQIFDVLQQGKVHLHKITIPEGYSLRQIAGLLEGHKLASAQEFIEAASNPALAESLLGTEAVGLEGYLFPDTYHFARGSSAEAIIRAMLGRFKQVFNESYRQQAAKLGFGRHQIVALASLIEKETANETERPLIASVYHNRLKQGTRLQCDPTVIYALEQSGSFDGNIRRQDLQLDSPYNTYRYKGLPPGPIASPGKASLLAALYPADTDYIYFVSRNDGTHKFSNSLKEHNQAVYKYQKRRKRKN